MQSYRAPKITKEERMGMNQINEIVLSYKTVEELQEAYQYYKIIPDKDIIEDIAMIASNKHLFNELKGLQQLFKEARITFDVQELEKWPNVLKVMFNDFIEHFSESRLRNEHLNNKMKETRFKSTKFSRINSIMGAR